MKKVKKKNLTIGISTMIFLLIVVIFFGFYIKIQYDKKHASLIPIVTDNPYSGTIYHIFFHSLIIYPDLAFTPDAQGDGYRNYMVTRTEFLRILDALYKNQFVLIDISSVYKVNADGSVSPKPLYIPAGKKPLIISLDDLEYYKYMFGNGFAHKLVLDQNGNVATEVITPDGKTVVTRDGDVVPILDDFVRTHPDFSIGGAKGVIAVTGFEGILGYRTQDSTSPDYTKEVDNAKKIIQKLKSTGWKFADHSYSHNQAFTTGTIPLTWLKADTEQWKKEVGSLVGPTDIFIGPFGQIFSPHDRRRAYLVSQGFKMICGVGMDLYLQYFPNYVVMDRADMDGYRLTHSHRLLKPYFDSKTIIDTEARSK